MYYGLFYYLREYVGMVVAVVVPATLAWLVLPGLFAGIFAGEVSTMFRKRTPRVAAWVVGVSGALALACLVPMDDYVSGTFKTRAGVRREVRAPVPGFLQVIHYDEGETLESGKPIGCLEIPDLTYKLAQKRAEVTETKAKLKLLEAGARPEQLAEQRLKVQRAREWRDRAQTDLDRKRHALREEISRLERAITQAQTHLSYNHIAFEQARKLLQNNALPQEQYREAERQCLVAKEQLGQAEAQKRERTVLGTLEQEGELARRQKELGDEQAALNLLEAGTRPEEIDAERARLTRLHEEEAYLQRLQERLRLTSPVSGLIVTPHLREKVGQFFKEGDLICEIEDPQSLDIEVPLEEHDVRRVEERMPVLLKPRALPLKSCKAEVERLAPLAVVGKVQSTVTVYCRLQEPVPELLSNMTGYARIYCERSSFAGYLGGRLLRYLRTEIWW
jgi:multidrug resistance efflux pump